MRKIATLLFLAVVWGVSSADTQDYVIGNVILARSNVAYFDVGEKDGVAPGQNFEIIYDERVVIGGVIDWADRNISRSRPLDSSAVAQMTIYEPMTVKIRLHVPQANRGGHLDVACFTELNLEPASIYTHEDMMVSRLIHRGLLTRDKEGSIIPDLCGDYEIRDLTYTFYLSPEARFHNDQPVKASDVAYSLEQLALAPKLTNFTCFVLEIAGVEDFRGQLKPEIAGIFLIDEYTISITLKRPFPSFEDYLAGPGGYIIPRPGYISTGMSTVGSGPYRIKWRSRDGLVLEPFEVPGHAVFLDSLRFIRYAKTEEAGLAFELGRLDMISLLGEPPPKFVTRGNYSSQNYETYASVILGINNERGFQIDENFGKALSFMIDRNSITRVLLGGAGGSPVFAPPENGGRSVSLSGPFQPDSAGFYLSRAQAMPKNVTIYIDSSYAVLGKVARYIQGQLQNKGIRVREKTIDLRGLDRNKAASDLDLYLTFHIPASGDPDCILYPLLSHELYGQTNFLGYEDEAAAMFLNDMHTQTDPDRAESISFGLAHSLVAEPPLIFLYRPYLTVIGKTDISGAEPDPTGFIDLRGVFIEMER